jgi:hypothetical protein
MSTTELLWTIVEERRREAAAAARERVARDSVRVAGRSLGWLVARLRGRLRLRKEPVGRGIGVTTAG